jgi:hypothetical protein
MASPFPGMNPYLEHPEVWHDFHQALITAIRTALIPQIRPSYLAKMDDHIYIHELSSEERRLLGRSDVSVIESGGGVATATAHSVNAPAYGYVVSSVDEIREPFIEIRDRESRELITVVEVLSPTNKSKSKCSDREQYLGKRKAILAHNPHLVEIDLLRGGERMPVEGMPECDYVIMVSRSYERPRVELWPLALRNPLPTIPIPLRHGDRDAIIDLQRLLHEQFDAAGYEDYIYHNEPQPPLSSAEAGWAYPLVVGNSPTARISR